MKKMHLGIELCFKVEKNVKMTLLVKMHCSVLDKAQGAFFIETTHLFVICRHLT